MNGYFVYIFTDNNRKNMLVGIANDFNHLFMGNSFPLSFEGYANVPKRLVHVEYFSSETEAERRCKQLQNWPKIQKEKLIRNNNPNWLDIGIHLPLSAWTERFIQLPQMKLAG